MEIRSLLAPGTPTIDPPQSAGAEFRRKTAGPLLTLATLLFIDFFSGAVFAIPNPDVIFLLTIVYSAFLGGMGPGLVSAGITIAHSIIFYSVPGRILYYTQEDLQRLVVISITAVSATVLVGRMKRHLNQTLARERAERARVEAVERRTRFVAEASEILTASLDPREMLQNVAQLTVTAGLADHCVIDIDGGAGRVLRVAAAHADPSAQEVGDTLQLYSTPLTQPAEAAAVLKTGQAILLPEVTEAHLELASRDSDHLRSLRGIDARSLMIVPMVARERTVGAITLASSKPGRSYSSEDLALATELARRAAIALDTVFLLQEAQQANRVKSDFLAVMSHELRTPLTAIIGFAELLSLGIPDPIPDEAQAQVERIASAGHHLAQMIEEILSFARMEAGRETVQAERVSLTGVIQDVADLMEPLAKEKGLTLDVALPSFAIPVETDRRKVRQILLNLISNSIKFTEQGTIRVWVEMEGDEVVLAVQDTGIGILPEHLDRVFEPFWQVEQAKTRRFGGTGLGLNVVRQLAELLGGEVCVQSRVGEGSTFTVRLPIRVPEETESSSFAHSA